MPTVSGTTMPIIRSLRLLYFNILTTMHGQNHIKYIVNQFTARNMENFKY